MRRYSSYLLAASALVIAPLMFGQTVLPNVATLNSSLTHNFSQTFTCSGCGSISAWQMQGSVPGLTFNTASGTLSGTPTTTGSFGISILPLDLSSVPYTSRDYTVLVDPVLVFTTPANLGTFTAGATLNLTIQTNINGINFINGVPAGLTLLLLPGASSASLQGSVAVPGAYQINASASSPGQAANRAFTLTIVPPPTLSASFPTGEVGQAYTGTLTAGQGVPPYVYGNLTPLPAGFGLNPSTGVVTGNPGTAGTFNFTAVVTDSNNVSTSTGVTFSIAPALAVPAATLPTGEVGLVYSTTVGSTGGVAPITWSLSSGTLPPGLGLSSGGAITGTPTTQGNFSFSLTARDALNVTAGQQFSIGIRPPLTLSSSFGPAEVGVSYSGSITAGGGSTPYVYSIQGALPGGLGISAGTGAITGTPTTAGTFNFTGVVTDFLGGTTSTAGTIVVAGAVAVSKTSLPAGDTGTAYSAQVGQTGGVAPFTWSLQSGALPPGLGITAGGLISGTPTTVGTFSFLMVVTDSLSAQASRTLSIVIHPPPSVTSTLGQAEVSVPYSGSLNGAGGTTPYVYSISAGTLPPGLQINAATGVITGTPTAAGTFNFTGTVTDAISVAASTAASIVVAPALAVSAGTLPTGEVTIVYGAQLASTGGVAPIGWTLAAGSLPPGLGLSSTGAIAGTPTVAGTFNFTAQAIDNLQTSASRAFSIVINALPVLSGNPPQGEMGQAYLSNLTATLGTTPYTFSIRSGALPPGLTLNASSGAISGTPTAAGNYGFTAAVTDALGGSNAAAFSINVLSTLAITTVDLPDGRVGGGYSAVFSASGGTGGYVWSLTSGSLPPGLTFSSNGTISGTATGPANATFTVQVKDSFGATVSRGFSISILSPLVIVTTSLPNGVPGTPYAASIAVNGGSGQYSFTLSGGSLPPGLTLSNGGGIGGTPTTSGSYSFTATAADSTSQSASRSFTILIGTGLSVTTASVPDGVVDAPYTVTFAAAGGAAPYSWSVLSGTLPPGLTLSTAGVLGGTPTRAGLYSFTIGVTDARQGSANRTFSLTVGTTLSITTASLPGGAPGAAYTASLTAAGGTPPYTFSLASGTLPAGLTLSNAGQITGTPTTAGTSNVTFSVTDGTRTATKALSIVISAGLQLPAATLPDGTRNAAYSTTLTATGGAQPYTFTVTGGSLPPGLTLAASGAITGTPTDIGTSTFTVRVTDAPGSTASQTFSIRVVDGPAITTTTLPDGTVGTDYTATLAATGTAPLTWTVSGALPPGLSLASTGAITGKPTTPGTYSITATVTDPNKLTASKALSIKIVLPAVSTATITQIPTVVTSGTQPPFGVTIAQTYPVDITGTATLAFQPDSGPGDPDVKFANGTTTVSFRIPAGQTVAAATASTDPLTFQTGTTSGKITITVVMSAGGQTLTPTPAVTRVITIDKAAPVITSAVVNKTSAGFEVVIIGYSNTRELTGSTFAFTGTNVTNSSVTVAITPAFVTWYGSAASAAFGTQFKLTVPFTLSSGAVSALTSVNVTLTNTVGSATKSANF